jgi:hypothetical protein
MPIGDELVRALWVSLRSKCPKSRWKEAKMWAIAGMRKLWLEWDSRTFDRVNASLQQVVQLAKEELDLWHASRQRVQCREK